MLSLIDCIAFSGLTPEQVDAIACFKHIPPIIAAEWAEQVLDRDDGAQAVETVLAKEVSFAHAHQMVEAERWDQGLAQFRHAHPELWR